MTTTRAYSLIREGSLLSKFGTVCRQLGRRTSDELGPNIEFCNSLDRDHEEADMEFVRLPITHFEEKLRTGEILDVCTIAAWGTYQLWLKSNR